tara:strand:- start:2702 stop:3136 length:435 start_codon:yes stop_codon:yes gene_type:complete
MLYAILDGTTVKSSGTLQSLFPNTSFPLGVPPTSFLTENNVSEVIETLSFTSPDQKLTKVDAYVSSDKVYNVKVESTTTTEKNSLITEQWSNIRDERDNLLLETDWRASGDLTISNDWKTYRQALRDITTQSDPFNITWPTKPT